MSNRFIVKNQQVYRKSKIPKSNDFLEIKFVPFAKRADMVYSFHSGYGHAGQASICSRCQLAAHSDKISHHAPMKPLEIPHAFSRWHLDFIGELPTTKNGNRWLLMAVDYTTNWPIARALNNATGEEIVKFIYEEIVMRFGCPEEILTDRGPNFMSKVCFPSKIQWKV
ncbi:hypothetical protein G6F32_014739 [Rhizopus arrhizus]|nr:hypothetical protein G6F32_014739 [Rhizopus arrhizus]